MDAWLKSTAAAVVLSVAMASGAAAQDDTQENQAEDNGVVLQDIVTTTHDEFGEYLTDGRMMALYMLPPTSRVPASPNRSPTAPKAASRHGRR